MDGEVTVYLGLGSNLGDREANLRNALNELDPDVVLQCTSSIYETDPWGYKEQPQFLNCVCYGSTKLQPLGLLAAVKNIERMIGREPTFTNGPRTIDLDILLYGDRLVEEQELVVPHVRFPERSFVLVPLAEIAPHLVHPRLGLTADQMLKQVDGRDSVKRWGPPIVI